VVKVESKRDKAEPEWKAGKNNWIVPGEFVDILHPRGLNCCRLASPVGWRGFGRKEHRMNLAYAVERLLDTGWTPSMEVDVDRLPDGRGFPSVIAVQREFSRAGLELSIKQNLMFGCYRATWGPVGEPLDPSAQTDERHGTVIGTCEREAAVYALSQLRSSQLELV
jgi:hypothetical protein